MDFFDQAPEPEPEPPRVHHPWEPPETEFPGNAQINTLQFERSGQAAIAITGISVYSTGFEIFVTRRTRPGAHDSLEHLPHAGRRMPEGLKSFEIGLQLSDGSKVIGGRHIHGIALADRDSEPTGPILRLLMGGGPFSRWWAWPLPPSGPLEFVCQWPLLGITETRVGIDAQVILDAARRSVQLWPEAADLPSAG